MDQPAPTVPAIPLLRPPTFARSGPVNTYAGSLDRVQQRTARRATVRSAECAHVPADLYGLSAGFRSRQWPSISGYSVHTLRAGPDKRHLFGHPWAVDVVHRPAAAWVSSAAARGRGGPRASSASAPTRFPGT